MSNVISQQLEQAHFYVNNGQIDKSKELLELILQKNHRNIDALQLLGIVHATNGNLNLAIEVFSRAIKLSPANPSLLFNRANAYSKTEQHQLALADIEKSLLITRNDYDSLLLHSYTSIKCGHREKALHSFDQILGLNPNDFNILVNKGNLLIDLLMHDEAVNIFARLVKIYPESSESYFEYGNALLKMQKNEDACTNYKIAITIKPDYADALNNLGNAYRKLSRPYEALECFENSIKINPNFADVHYNRGGVLLDLGLFTESINSYNEAIRIDPYFTLAHCDLLFCMNYAETHASEVTSQAATRYGSIVSSMAVPKFKSWLGHTEPNNKLNVGFVSGDLKNHPVGFFLEGLIENLDSDKFDLFSYATSSVSDDLTERIKPYFKEWAPIYDMSDLKAAQLIHDQGINILIDLSGHTINNRLGVFAFKPAAVQATYLGYFATTGIPEIDYFFGDPCMCPPGEEHHFTEKIYRLSETWLCLKPPTIEIPISAVKHQDNRSITFGCFGNLNKINDEVVSVWSSIICRIPNSKLFLKSHQLTNQVVISSVRDRFIKNGVSNNSLILEGPSSREAYYEAYNCIDIVLDTFPYPGGTTSIDAYWMGVPVLTLRGNRFLSRLGESIARNAGASHWIANNQSEYIDKAIAYASEIQSHPNDRLMGRNKVLNSVLFNPKRFTKNFEDALSKIWQDYTLNSN